jgi:hypothetical protein
MYRVGYCFALIHCSMLGLGLCNYYLKFSVLKLDLSLSEKNNNKASIPGLVVRAEGSGSRGCGFKSHRIVDRCNQSQLLH